jgi:energy-coupling factor transporter transmembrane protein EcfT
MTNFTYRRNLKKFLSLPWWTRFITYLVSLSIITGSIVTTLVLRAQFMPEVEVSWLLSFIVSILVSLLVIEPFQAFVAVAFYVGLHRREVDTYSEKVKQDERVVKSALVDREKPVKLTFSLESKTVEPARSYEFIRQERLLERELRIHLKDVFAHAILLLCLFLIINLNYNSNFYRYQSSLSKLISMTDTARSIDQVLICV